MSTLILTALAALIVCFFAKNSQTKEKWNLSLLICMFAGASLMWCADVFFELCESGLGYFNEQSWDVIRDDSCLGAAVIFAGLSVWAVSIFAKSLNLHSQQQLCK